MTDNAGWLTALGMSNHPKGLGDQVKQVTKEPPPKPSKIAYTPRDHECFQIILAHPVVGHPELDDHYCEVSNSVLGKIMGMTAGAAAARVSRLIKMGVVKPWYDMAVETGKVNRRVLEVVQYPPTPWSPNA